MRLKLSMAIIAALALATGSLAPAQTAASKAEQSQAPAAPKLTYVFSLRVEVGKPLEQGTIAGARRRFIPITGGTVSGPKLHGTVLAGGGDWQSIHSGGLVEVEARYFLKADDGTIISIHNPGLRVASADVTEQLARGENVDPSAYYFRAAPQFSVADGPHDWLRRKLFVARGVRRPDHVLLDIYAVE